MDQGEGDLPERLSTDLDPSFERLMLTYWPQLYAFVLRRVESQQDAEDIVSEAFVRAYLALKGYPPERVRTLKLRPWLYKITYHEYCRFIGRATPPSVPFAVVELGMGVEQQEDQRKQPELSLERAERLYWLLRTTVRERDPLGIHHPPLSLCQMVLSHRSRRGMVLVR